MTLKVPVNTSNVPDWIRKAADAVNQAVERISSYARSFSTQALNVGGQQTIPLYPIGNAGQITLASDVVQADTDLEDANEREFLSIIGFNVAHGYDAVDATRAQHDKVAQYVGLLAFPGCADVWAVNHLLTLQSGVDPINSHVNESDLNNNSGVHYGDAPGGTGLGPQSAYVFAATGAGTHRITAGYLAAFSGAGANRGYVAATGCIQSGFEDCSSATVAFRAAGANTNAFSSKAAFCVGPHYMLGNGHRIAGRNAADTADLTVAEMGTDNRVYLGGRSGGTEAAAGVSIKAAVPTYATNAAALGGGLVAGDIYQTSTGQLMITF